MAMSVDFTSNEFAEPLRWIRRKREKGVEWIDLETRPSESPLHTFLEKKEKDDYWPHMDISIWKELVNFQRENEKNTIDFDIKTGQALVVDGASDNNTSLPDGERTCWQLYKTKLKEKGFADESIGEIERATSKILKRLSDDTRESGPVKGMVIGNVQSGKTANMAALMAMAADWGWNFFIILSGTIENLRLQTQSRLNKDLHTDGGNLFWFPPLQHLSPQSPEGYRAQDLHFEENSRCRYFTVSLKNAGRLKGLIQWLQRDRNKMQQMKILVIDDEADQAGINTASVDSKTRRQINRLICALVNGQNTKSRDIPEQYLAMNYIGYTATPYANILNESSLESLYPKNFIATLSVSSEYFGPQQVFGSPDGRYEGMDVIREVPISELNVIKNIHKGTSNTLPNSFKDAVCWFICSVAAMRYRGFKEPISMLIHTSQKVKHHANISDAVESWINSSNNNDLIERCRLVWESETKQFSIGEFMEQYPDYGRAEMISDYPSFKEIKDGIIKLLAVKLKPIKMDEESTVTYHDGIHLCIDNSKNNKVNDQNEYLRLVYPDDEKMPTPAPAFMVIGGATLSRGLTLKGLVCTFFLRSVKQADTLMQMGRWFGYRKGYELYPRVWLSGNTKEQFEYLSMMDQELREEIRMMEVRGLRPDRYAVKIRNTPNLGFIRITARNRMQSVMDAEMDYSGSYNQTYIFDNDKVILDDNLKIGRKFIESLGIPREQKICNPHSEHAVVWEGVPFSKIEVFLKEFKFYKNLTVFNDLDPLIAWIKKITEDGDMENWNVVLAGKKNNVGVKTWSLENCKVAKVSRTRKNTKNENPKIINIGALRAPLDLIADVDLDGKDQSVIDFFTNLPESRIKEARMKAGLGKTPQLLMYLVDKDSSPRPDSKSRKPLNAPADILGVCINIPSGVGGDNCVARVSIRLDKTLLSGSDLDENYNEDEDNQ